MGQRDQLDTRLTVCDTIFEYGGEGQPMEVVEHILHFISNVGLHFTFIDDWGVNRTSKQYTEMLSAINNNNFIAPQYGDLNNDENARVYLQEYAYLVITSNWGINKKYCADCENEWKLQDPADLETTMPDMHALVERTIPKVMVVPSEATMQDFAAMPFFESNH